GRIQEIDSQVKGAVDRRHRLLFRMGTIEFGHTHAAQPEGRNLKRTVTKFPELHWVLMTRDNEWRSRQHSIGMKVAQGFQGRQADPEAWATDLGLVVRGRGFRFRNSGFAVTSCLTAVLTEN